jgi:hypothetical protein
MWRPALSIATLAGALLAAGCAGKSSLTAAATGCKSGDVDIVPSVFQQQGRETAWCATCGGKRYQCATNAERTRTVCMPSKEGDGCL